MSRTPEHLGTWVKSYRRKERSRIWTEAHPLELKLFEWILHNARVFPTTYEGRRIRRGELFTTYREMAERIAYRDSTKRGRPRVTPSLQTMRTLVRNLSNPNDGEIAVLSTEQGLHLKVCNYERYQGAQVGGQQGGQQGAHTVSQDGLEIDPTVVATRNPVNNPATHDESSTSAVHNPVENDPDAGRFEFTPPPDWREQISTCVGHLAEQLDATRTEPTSARITAPAAARAATDRR